MIAAPLQEQLILVVCSFQIVCNQETKMIFMSRDKMHQAMQHQEVYRSKDPMCQEARQHEHIAMKKMTTFKGQEAFMQIDVKTL